MKFRYSGPISGATLRDGEQDREVMLHPGGEVDLPEQHEYTKTLLALGYLMPIAQSRATTKTSAAARDESAKGA